MMRDMPKHSLPLLSPATLSRRQLLAAAATTAVAAPVLGNTNTAQAATSGPQVPRRVLGKTGKSVPILLLGGGAGFDPKFDRKIAEALKYGVDYVDAARVYAGGTCEAHAGRSLKRLKALDSTWITSKSEATDAVGFEKNLEISLKELGRSWVDLYYLHGIEDPAPLTDKKLLAAVERLKAAGKIKHFGFSCHDGNVAELLQRAAGVPQIDSIMFRYNFRQYGNKKLNLAIDAAHKAGIGLIAMKTQGAEASFRDAWKKFEKTGKWTKHQAVLKAVWADSRITAAVSHMDSLEKLRANIAAALDRTTLGAAEWHSIDRYAKATRHLACDGCGQLCGQAAPKHAHIATAMRCLMYHEVYGDTEKARRVFSALPNEARRLEGDFSAATSACPHNVDITAHMARARQILT